MLSAHGWFPPPLWARMWPGSACRLRRIASQSWRRRPVSFRSCFVKGKRCLRRRALRRRNISIYFCASRMTRLSSEFILQTMAKLLLKGVRYLKCYGELAFGGKPTTIEGTIDYCVDRPILMTQVRSEALALGKILQTHAPVRSLEIGTNYGGTLLLLCNLSPPKATIISVDLPSGRFGGGYPRRKIPLFRKFRKSGQQLHLIRADSHFQETKERVLSILHGDLLD